ncbi:hypothetical protein QRX60_09730 [Amycolatopsis mongoliensis]|uniref:Secreted protein n=1 Tax=Amycolatopsis mongoliensis TaxID=715475 RepID=A0A9Y2JTT8_9PSEU|nr:hypothetical protein [Amycolatopsis sp. 4-36]WIY04103.1 hypothetical protein QRX60_09730 [Amycolatopsis sp. 4-36]
MRRIRWIAAIVLVTAGCGQAGSGTEAGCPAIGTPVGIGLTVPDPAGITRATLEACWGGQCVTRPVGLFPETAAGPTSCTGTGPDSSCGASMVPTGGLQGFADIPGLPAEPIRVTVRFDDGKPHTVAVTPAFTEPGGPACGKAGPQAQLVAGPGHELKPR